MIINNKETQNISRPNTIKMGILFIMLLIVTITVEVLSRFHLLILSNQLLSHIQANKAKEHLIFILSFFMKYLGNIYIYFGIVLVIFNRENIFKPFCLLNIIFICEVLSGFFKLIYKQDHPYNITFDEYPLLRDFSSNERSWAFPSKSLLLAPVFYFSVLRMYTSNKVELIKRKIIGTIVVFLLIVSIASAEFLLGYSSLGQIIFSIAISYLIYFFIYQILRINYSNGARQLHRILKISIKKILMVNALTLLIMLWLYLSGSYISGQQIEANEAFCCFFIFFGNISLYGGAKLELIYYFNDSYNNWSQYNFDPQNEKEIIGSSLIDKISISRGVQWNRTKTGKSLGRLLILIALGLVCFAISIIGNIETSSPLFVIFVKVLIPITAYCLTVGYAFKIVAFSIGLCNDNMFTMIRESI